MFITGDINSADLERASRNVHKSKSAECSKFAASSAGIILTAIEEGKLSNEYNITIAGIPDTQNHNVVIICPKNIEPPTTAETFVANANEILIIDPWAYALGHGNSCVYELSEQPTPQQFTLLYMLNKAVIQYQSKNDSVHENAVQRGKAASPNQDKQDIVAPYEQQRRELAERAPQVNLFNLPPINNEKENRDQDKDPSLEQTPQLD